MTYLWLSVGFLAASLAVAALAILRLWRRASDARLVRAVVGRWVVPVALAGVVVMVLTAVFDNVMIGIGLMSYAPEHISGVLIGAAPIEDFAYPLAALILLPALWNLFGARRKRRAS